MIKKAKKFLFDNSLSLAMFSLFLLTFLGLIYTGFLTYNSDQAEHHQRAISVWEYIKTSSFYEAVFENWESEFLQMWIFVMLTIFLRQKGSAESKKLRGKEAVDASSKYSLFGKYSRKRAKAVKDIVYSNSLGLALLALFIFSFILHGVSGSSAYNQEQIEHGENTLSLIKYFLSSQFWFESFQNWQSEFLSVGALIVLAIYLRQRGSPESKPVSESNSETGSE